MKKNKMMRIASVLLVMTLLSTCIISGTFAKYVTSGSGEDTARVAKWGVVVKSEGTMFAKEYKTDDADFVDKFAVSVKSDVNVVAPGTKGEFAGFTMSGTPEVGVKFVFTDAELELEGDWEDAEGAFYCPIIISLGSYDGPNKVDGSTFTSADALIAAVKDLVADLPDSDVKYAGPGTDLSQSGGGVPKVFWQWPFEVGDDADAIAARDAKDTNLGNIAAGVVSGKTAPELTLTLTMSVVQVD